MATAMAAIGLGATANIIGTEASHLIDNVSHYVEEKVHGFIESHTTGKRKRRRGDLASATNDEQQHMEDVHRPDSSIPNDHEANTPVHGDGPDTLKGYKEYRTRIFNCDELYACSPGKWAVEHLRAKMGPDLFQKLCADNLFITGVSIDYSFFNYNHFPVTMRMILVQDMQHDNLNEVDAFYGNRIDFFAKPKGQQKYHFDNEGNPVAVDCYDHAKKIQMRLNPERYKVIWNKYISLGQCWPGAFTNIYGPKNNIKGRFFIKIPNGVKVRSVHGVNSVMEGYNEPVNKLVPNIKFFMFWEFNNMEADMQRRNGHEYLTKTLNGYMHLNTYLKH